MKNEKTLPVKLSRPAQRALANAGITSLPQLARLTEKELSQMHGIGPNAIAAIRQALKENGLHLAG